MAKQGVNQPPADTELPRIAAHDKRADFRDRPAQRRQFGARDHGRPLQRDNEAMRVPCDFVAIARQQVSFGQMILNQAVHGISLASGRGAEQHRCVANSRCPGLRTAQ